MRCANQMNNDVPPTLLENTSEHAGSWLLVDAPEAMRAFVTIRAPAGSTDSEGADRVVYRHRVIGGSYVSVDDHRLHFGLGTVSGAVRLEIAWPDGTDTVFTGLPVNRVLRLPSEP